MAIQEEPDFRTTSGPSGGKDLAPLVSVMVGVYNHERYVVECLDSLARSSYPRLELIVVDDASRDRSAEIVRAWINDHPGLSISFLAHEQNRGFIRSLNEAIALATGEYFCLIAADDAMLPDGIGVRVAYLEKHAKKLAVFGDCHVIDEHGQEIHESGIDGLFSRAGMRKDLLRIDELMPSNIVFYGAGPGPTFMCRSSAFATVGLYDESLQVEDWDMYLRMAATGGLGFVDAYVAKYRRHQVSATFTLGVQKRTDTGEDRAKEHPAIRPHQCPPPRGDLCALPGRRIDVVALAGGLPRLEQGGPSDLPPPVPFQACPHSAEASAGDERIVGPRSLAGSARRAMSQSGSVAALVEQEWPADGLERVPTCLVCRQEERRVLHDGLSDRVFFCAPGRWTLYRCDNCGSAYLDPRPTPATIGLAYQSYYTHAPSSPAPASRVSPVARFRLGLCHGYLNGRYGHRFAPSLGIGATVVRLFPRLRANLDRSVRHLPRPRQTAPRLLDVGCGNGSYLTYMRSAGWEVHGIDPDPAAAIAARTEGIDIQVGTISEVDLADESFDAITLNHVIEHLHEPAETLRRCYDLLRPGGVLWIATPNLASAGHRLFGRNWRGLEPPRHLVLFNPRSLQSLLTKVGFAVVTTDLSRASSGLIFRKSAAIARGGEANGDLARGLKWKIRLRSTPRISAVGGRRGTRHFQSKTVFSRGIGQW